MESALLESIMEEKISKGTLYTRVVKNFNFLPEVIEGVDSPEASIRYGCSKVLVSLSANYPAKLYPYMDGFLALLGSNHRILIWNAIAIIANLAAVDSEKKIDAQFGKIYSLMNSGYLVTVANLINSSSKIGQTKPYLIPKITTELIRVESLKTTPHLTEECKLVLTEKALRTFDALFSKMDDKDKLKVMGFAKRNKNSARKRLSSKAELFLNKWSKTQ